MVVVISVLGLLLVLLLRIGDLVGAGVFGLVIAVLGWVYWEAETEKSRKQRREEQR
jgi:hypothetical protein